MGICISVSEKDDDDDENVTIFEERKKVPNGSQRLFSVYSKQGTKGLNQDAASIHQVSFTVSLFKTSDKPLNFVLIFHFSGSYAYQRYRLKSHGTTHVFLK